MTLKPLRPALRGVVVTLLVAMASWLAWLATRRPEPRLPAGPLPKAHAQETGAPPALRGSQPSPAAPSTTPPPQPAEAPALGGVVLDHLTSNPVARAWVFLQTTEGMVSSERAVRSGDDGTFLLPIPSGSSELLLRALANGYREHAVTLPGSTIRQGSQVLRLERGASFVGYVRDDQGVPVGGARVWCAAEENRVGWPHSEVHLDVASGGTITESAADGSFTISGVEAGRTYELTAAKDLYQTAVLLIGDSERASPPSLVMLPVAEVALTIVDSASGRRVDATTLRARVTPSSDPASSRARAVLQSGETHVSLPGTVRTRWLRPAGTTEPEATVIVNVSALGFAEREVKIRCAWGSRVAEEIQLVRTSSDEARDVRLTAGFAGGAPFHGELLVVVTSLGDHVGVRTACTRVAFSNGLGTPSLRLFPGEYAIGSLGEGAAGVWWQAPSDIVETEVARVGDTRGVHLTLRGSSLVLTVVDEAGVQRRGYGLQVAYDAGDGPGHLLPDWDIPGGPNGAPSPSAGGQRVFVAPGRGTLRVNLPVVGSGVVRFEGADDGREVPVTITLDQASVSRRSR